MTDQPYYFGWIKANRFKDAGTTSAYAFDYEALNINLIRVNENEKKDIEIIGEVLSDVLSVPGQDGLFKFWIKEYHHTEDKITTKNYQSYSHDPSCMWKIVKGYKIKARGKLKSSIMAIKNS